MAIVLKSSEQIEQIRRSGRIVCDVLNRLGEMVAPGITTKELDSEADRLTRERGAECLFKGVPGKDSPFPGNICASLNEQVVHGIPGDRCIASGDIVSIDFGVRLNGWCSDAARTFIVGQAPQSHCRLVEVTQNALAMLTAMVRPGEKWSSLARAIQSYIESEGFSVVREFVGHGIGRDMHEEPKLPNFVSRELEANDILLAEGMVLCPEPMVNLGSHAVECADDGWSVVTKDGSPSAHFEHTIAVTADGADVLTDGR